MYRADLPIGDERVPVASLSDDGLMLYFADRLGRQPRQDTAPLYLAIMRAFQAAGFPQTVRQVYYQTTVLGAVPKTENGYKKVADHLLKMRQAGIISYSWVADNTRMMRKPDSYNSLEEFLEISRQAYRRALWSEVSDYAEIWCEKDALSGILLDVTEEYDVPLMISRGFASATYLYTAAEAIKAKTRAGKRAYIYYFGDYDPSGVAAREDIRRKLASFGARVHFEAVAVTPAQIIDWQLPSRPTKQTDSRFKTWEGGDSVELDAIPAYALQDLAKRCIERHIDAERLRKARLAERLEKASLATVIDKLEAQKVEDEKGRRKLQEAIFLTSD